MPLDDEALRKHKASLQALESKINEQCDSVSATTSSVFFIAIFLNILRPDPTLTICLFGFYGAHTRSRGAIRTFWFFLAVSILVDFLWLFVYSPMRPITFDTLKSLSRKDQLTSMFSVLNSIYKATLVWTSRQLEEQLKERELLVQQWERDAELDKMEGGTTSTGEPTASGSLAAQDASSS